MWLTGHSFIKAKVKQERAPFGGELSGHFFFMDNFYGHDDTAYATLRLLTYLKRTNQTLTTAIKALPAYVSSPEIKLGLADAIKFKFIDDVISKEIQAMFPTGEYVTIDGFRADTDNEMVIVRASQNGPYITVKFEGKTREQYNAIKGRLALLLHSHPEIDWKSGVNIHAFD